MTYCRNCFDSYGENTIKHNEQVEVRGTESKERKSEKHKNNVKYTQKQLMQVQDVNIRYSLTNQLILLLINLLVRVQHAVHSQRC